MFIFLPLVENILTGLKMIVVKELALNYSREVTRCKFHSSRAKVKVIKVERAHPLGSRDVIQKFHIHLAVRFGYFMRTRGKCSVLWESSGGRIHHKSSNSRELQEMQKDELGPTKMEKYEGI